MKKSSVLSFVSAALILFLASCDDQITTFTFEFDTAPAAFDTTAKTKTVLEPGFYFFDIETGTGDVVAPLDVVRLHYTLRSLPDLKVISSTYVNGNTTPVVFILAQRIEAYSYTGFQTNDFIALRRGVPGMRVGGKRTVLLPAEYGFGLNTRFVLDINLELVIK